MVKTRDFSKKMAHAHELLNEKENFVDNVIDFSKRGSGDGGEGLNWLVALAEQTVFLAKDKNSNKNMTHPRYACRQFVLAKKFEKAYLLIEDVRGQNAPIMVDPTYFSMDFNKFEVLYDPLIQGPLLFEGDEGYDDDSNLSPAAKESLEAAEHATVSEQETKPPVVEKENEPK